jgi:hypothetical protein
MCSQASVSTMELMDSSFERALRRRLSAELDALHVEVPVAAPGYSRRRSMRYVWAVGRPIAVALAVALLLGSVAAFASGSPNPANWVNGAERSLGITPSDDQIPNRAEDSPSPQRSEDSPSPHPSTTPSPHRAQSTVVAPEPGETQSPEPVERQSPEPVSSEPNDTPTPGDG